MKIKSGDKVYCYYKNSETEFLQIGKIYTIRSVDYHNRMIYIRDFNYDENGEFLWLYFGGHYYEPFTFQFERLFYTPQQTARLLKLKKLSNDSRTYL